MTATILPHATNSAPRFRHRLRVRWAEVDMQKIVFNAHYLMYFDTAIAEYWRAMGMPYEKAMHQLGGDLFVKKASIEFNASARLDDVLDVTLQCVHLGQSSMRFQGGIYCGNAHLIVGELIYVYADPKTQTSQPTPPVLRKWIMDYEKGLNVTSIKTGSWAALGHDASAVRTEVFVQEQKIPLDMEWDEADTTCIHAVAYNPIGQPLATGRLLPHEEAGVCKIGRMAVVRVMRGSHLGQSVFQSLMQVAKSQNYKEVRLHAQQSAQGFYARLGFQPRGESFVEADIPHIKMSKTI